MSNVGLGLKGLDIKGMVVVHPVKERFESFEPFRS